MCERGGVRIFLKGVSPEHEKSHKKYLRHTFSAKFILIKKIS